MAPNSRVWLITGCSSGFGLELAKTAASRGDRVLAASRNPDKAKDLAGLENITLVRLDPNGPLPKIKEAINDIIAIHGTVDVVVNNAAYVQTGTIEETTPEETLAQYQANVFGPLNVYRAVLPHLRGKGQGTLVTIGSMASWFPANGANLYDSSKAALRLLTLGLAGEVKGFGIQHCLVEPGTFRTDLLKPNSNMTGTPPSTRLPEYDEINVTTENIFKQYNGHQLGNPVKGMEIIYEVVTSTGVAEGKPLPESLALGSDALAMISQAANKTLEGIEEWRSVSAMSDIPEGK